eukprot:TRINITY_DN8691_c0_g1_i1.p2 TRINITY_DN8691_c0_g1~~TRINITY_DN8691_c0_g1_i1.p2  ORF type:complete len:182 (+),score=49.00 TRINITY_DN8691_c0_g1_i1:45-590(+)
MQDNSVQGRHHFWEILKGFDNCMLTTLDDKGFPRARPMHISRAAEDERTLWIMSGANSLKNQEIQRNNLVNLSFSSGSLWASLEATAEIVNDRTKIHELWSPAYGMYFKDRDDPNISLLKVTPISGEYWDVSGIKNRFSFAYETIKTMLSHKAVNRDNLGENKKVDFEAISNYPPAQTRIA